MNMTRSVLLYEFIFQRHVKHFAWTTVLPMLMMTALTVKGLFNSNISHQMALVPHFLPRLTLSGR